MAERMNFHFYSFFIERGTAAVMDKPFVDFYELLDLHVSATSKELTKQYRVKSLLYHPDKQGGSDELFHQLKVAFDTLKNPETRRTYDDTYKARMEHKIRLEQMDSKRKAGRDLLERREEEAKRARTVDRERSAQQSVNAAILREQSMRDMRHAEKLAKQREGQLRMDGMGMLF